MKGHGSLNPSKTSKVTAGVGYKLFELPRIRILAKSPHWQRTQF